MGVLGELVVGAAEMTVETVEEVAKTTAEIVKEGTKEVTEETVENLEKGTKEVAKEVFNPDKIIKPLESVDEHVASALEEKFDPDKIIDVNNVYDMSEKEVFNPDVKISVMEDKYSYNPTYINPDGYWDGIRGESNFVFINSEAFAEGKEFRVDRIPYKDGNPDFSSVSKAAINIDMVPDRYLNFRQADEKLAERFNNINQDGKSDWTARDIYNYRAGKYTWHEKEDMKTCMLVPMKIHEVCRHEGGYSSCKKMLGKESVFDE